MAIEGVSNNNIGDAARVTTKPKSNVEMQGMSVNITETVQKLPVGNRSDSGKKEKVLTEQHIKSAINVANNKVHRTTCEFSYHEATKRVSIKVKDKETDEIIREIPPEEALEMLQKMWEMAGILVDERR